MAFKRGFWKRGKRKTLIVKYPIPDVTPQVVTDLPSLPTWGRISVRHRGRGQTALIIFNQVPLTTHKLPEATTSDRDGNAVHICLSSKSQISNRDLMAVAPPKRLVAFYWEVREWPGFSPFPGYKLKN